MRRNRVPVASELKLKCGKCGKVYRVPVSMAGRRVKCKACAAVFRVPAVKASRPGPARPAGREPDS